LQRLDELVEVLFKVFDRNNAREHRCSASLGANTHPTRRGEVAEDMLGGAEHGGSHSVEVGKLESMGCAADRDAGSLVAVVGIVGVVEGNQRRGGVEGFGKSRRGSGKV